MKDLTYSMPYERPLELQDAYLHLQTFLESASNWYIAKKQRKRAWSKAVRGLTLVFAVLGGLIPISASVFDQVPLGFGYLLLGLAGAVQLFDRGFSLSTGWSRHLSCSLALQECSMKLALEYAAFNAHQPHEESKLWQLLRSSSEEAWKVIASETSEWAIDLSSFQEELKSQPLSGN
ncbi:hypothetical protein J2T11_000043 [Paenarthrobacter nicotinovorans]|uniref:SLATT domain-containing protein n=1 Tax=Paenarthrobacter nicotinovorans TaxID=29320 RepID=UPI0027816975|nr:SLATT domain-containing protein [Paenarthrobacter nicotinovorans]MDP9933719.1 hypothetical protein [Paenarthrobacter nicotinovorans]